MLYEIDAPRVRNEKKLYETPNVHPSTSVRKCMLGSYTDLGPASMFANSTIGEYSYFAGDNQVIWADVGKFTSVAAFVRVNPGNHPMGRITQHHMTYRRKQYGLDTEDDAEFFEWRAAHRCSIGHDVWIGHGAIVLPGVRVGNGAAIGAGAVVSRDIPDFAVAVGVPARVIKYRFDPETIEKINEMRWWDWDRETLLKRWRELLSADFANNSLLPEA